MRFKMHRFWLLILPICVACGSGAEDIVADEKLSGWESIGGAIWEWRTGEVVAEAMALAPDGFLVTTSSYRDFRLRLEFKPDAEVNSGVFIRCQDRERIHPETCYEINIWDQHPNQQMRTGAIVLRAMPPRVHLDSIGRWNTYDISARGGRISVQLNGVETARLEDANPSGGFIALQRANGGAIAFRNMRIDSD